MKSKAFSRAALSATIMTLSLGFARQASADYEPHRYTEPGTGLELEYNLYVPENYDPTQKYPLMVFLHAAGQDSDLPRSLQSDGRGWTGSFLDNGDDEKYPSFFLVPISQTNRSGWGDGRSDEEKFEGRLTIVVLKELVASGEYNIDADRLYVTGPSMGGRGTWDMIEKNPGLFAAAVPAAAPGLDDAAQVINENIWAINGENDSTVEDNRDTIAAIRALGGNPIYTELARHGHDTWRSVYPTDAFMDWVYAQRRGVPWWHVSEVPAVPDPLTEGQPAVTGPMGPDDVIDETGGTDGTGDATEGDSETGTGAETSDTFGSGGTDTEASGYSTSTGGNTSTSGGTATGASTTGNIDMETETGGMGTESGTADAHTNGSESGGGSSGTNKEVFGEKNGRGCSISQPGGSPLASLLALFGLYSLRRRRSRS